ncbi:hypothetical protein NC651_010820 [Populus alba x Populus x berolinensis]|nr:hypothetical protein NC651_010820 [Populus alba x Populus x berolinensis]
MDKSPRFGSINSDDCLMKTRYNYSFNGFLYPSHCL